MSFTADFLGLFMPYEVFYPEKGQPGYDGVHDGGFKCLREDAPESAKKAFAEYLKLTNEKDESGARIKY